MNMKKMTLVLWLMALLTSAFAGDNDSIQRPPIKGVVKVSGTLSAIKTGTPALSNFASSGPFSETVLLGNLALRLGKRVEWDAKNLVAKNAPEAAPLIRRSYRKGWELA